MLINVIFMIFYSSFIDFCAGIIKVSLIDYRFETS